MEHDNEELFETAVREFKRIAEANEVPELLVGAYAREILLREQSDSTGLRRTRDVDFGIKVDSWAMYEHFRKALFESEHFTPFGTGHPHKVLFEGQMEVDLVPFGGVAGKEQRLSCWPMDFQQEMNVTGYEEALAQARLVAFLGSNVRVVTLEAFVVLKFFSWNDRPDIRQKDAVDIAYLLSHSGTLPSVLEELYSLENQDLVDAITDFDRLYHRWLGHKISLCFSPRSKEALCEILDREISSEDWKLARQMKAFYRDPNEANQALSDLRKGMA